MRKRRYLGPEKEAELSHLVSREETIQNYIALKEALALRMNEDVQRLQNELRAVKRRRRELTGQ